MYSDHHSLAHPCGSSGSLWHDFGVPRMSFGILWETFFASLGSFRGRYGWIIARLTAVIDAGEHPWIYDLRARLERILFRGRYGWIIARLTAVIDAGEHPWIYDLRARLERILFHGRYGWIICQTYRGHRCGGAPLDL
jgi:hypothetical protein